MMSFLAGKTVYRVAIVLILSLGVARIVSTYGEFTETRDEPGHIACGMQLLQDRVYTLEVAHAPLARIFMALGPYLEGLRMPEQGDLPERGNAILNGNANYWRNLALARSGILPFFLLASITVWLWSNKICGPRGALLSLLSFSLLPPILAHGSIATTDMAVAATLALAVYRFTLWLQKPGWRTAAWLGAAVALALLSKLSVVLFFPGCVAAVLLLAFASGGASPVRALTLRKAAAQAVIGGAVFYLVMCAGYLFAAAPLQAKAARPHEIVDRMFHGHPAIHDALYTAIETPFPAAQAALGILQVTLHAEGGHSAFFLGEWRRKGWWYYFPVLLVVKTPLPFLVLVLIGGVLLVRSFRAERDWRPAAPLACAVAMLVLVLPVHVNIGLRHILPIYPMLAVVSGYAATRLWDAARWPRLARSTVAVAVLCLAVSSLRAHPNYLSYFNELAFNHPERIEVDSDLDWGQDLARLSRWLRAKDVREVALSYFGTADLYHAELPAFHELDPYGRVTGWVAISAYNLALPSPFLVRHFATRAAYYSIPDNFEKIAPREGPFTWLKAYRPITKIGSSILVYDIPPAESGMPGSGAAP